MAQEHGLHRAEGVASSAACPFHPPHPHTRTTPHPLTPATPPLRFRPLYLSNARYEELAQLWLGDAFDFDSGMLHAANRSSTQASMF